MGRLRSVPRLLGATVALLLAGLPARAEGPPEMAAEAIGRVAARWRHQLFLVVADAGPCRVQVDRVVSDPGSLYRKRRVGCAVHLGNGRHLLTTASVAGVGGEVEVFTQDGRHALARVVGADRYLDLALLEAIGGLHDLAYAQPLVAADEPGAATPCLVLGSAYGRSLSATLGRIGGTIEIEPGGLPIRVHRVLAPIYPGDSGGLVVDAEGRFAGILTGVSDPRQPPVFDAFGTIDLAAGDPRAAGSVGFAVPAQECLRAWEDLARFGRVRRGFLGIQIDASADDRGGVRILEVTRDGPAHRAGIVPGDVVTTFGGSFLASGRQLCALVASTAPGRVVDIVVRRGERERHVPVTLGVAKRRPGLRRVPVVAGPDTARPRAPIVPVDEETRGRR
jgi:S1-C subfamily serine protease